MDADWHALAQAICEETEGSEWEELHDHDREISKATGARKPGESQKAKALWKMKVGKEQGEEFYESEREDKILGRNEMRLEVWREHLKDPFVALDKASKCVEFQCQG